MARKKKADKEAVEAVKEVKAKPVVKNCGNCGNHDHASMTCHWSPNSLIGSFGSFKFPPDQWCRVGWVKE